MVWNEKSNVKVWDGADKMSACEAEQFTSGASPLFQVFYCILCITQDVSSSARNLTIEIWIIRCPCSVLELDHSINCRDKQKTVLLLLAQVKRLVRNLVSTHVTHTPSCTISWSIFIHLAVVQCPKCIDISLMIIIYACGLLEISLFSDEWVQPHK